MKSVVNKPWGSFEIIDEGTKHTVKKIIVHPDGKLSLQSHEHRSEHWLIASGSAEVIIDDETYNLKENDNIFIPKGSKHMLVNKVQINLIMNEMRYGDKLYAHDIKRYEDIYKKIQ